MSAQDGKIDLDDEIKRLQKKSEELTKKTFANLDAWQVSRMARHPNRPYTLDYIEHIFTEFDELAGDRAFADDKAIVGGIARLEGRPVMVIGHQKGRTTKEKVKRNFGMPAPEGYRKALRLMEMAERLICRLLPLSTHRAHTLVSVRKNVVRRKLSRATYVKWRN
ncbi:acetyl-CoA carboxylase carboxyltransferase subunit alpha [Actinobacillus equuli]|nr:acetyl-CoA carboxylase carboxyltransferase subunit alpha [Actinobacillus equuli]